MSRNGPPEQSPHKTIEHATVIRRTPRGLLQHRLDRGPFIIRYAHSNPIAQTLLVSRFSQTDTRTTAILIDELDAQTLKRIFQDFDSA